VKVISVIIFGHLLANTARHFDSAELEVVSVKSICFRNGRLPSALF
jgi:hypothetical protein